VKIPDFIPAYSVKSAETGGGNQEIYIGVTSTRNCGLTMDLPEKAPLGMRLK
jgi:hypothetical protein